MKRPEFLKLTYKQYMKKLWVEATVGYIVFLTIPLTFLIAAGKEVDPLAYLLTSTIFLPFYIPAIMDNTKQRRTILKNRNKE